MGDVKRFEASDAFIRWAESVSGMLTTIKTKYGGVAKMLGDPLWDDSKSQYARKLVSALRDHISRISAEMHEHEQGKPY